ncbi:tryptophan RNA-binding attenuator protein-like domain-containing protein [Pavlovales sp. CCMP2436]|nr:tryptophan RNA-binding attenuator protein-like domain-containing protein [Pavlovales sp. CCMP2436]
MCMTDGLTMSTKFTGMAIFSGEAVAKVRSTNNRDSDGHVGMATNMPMACVIPIHMEDYGGQLNCKRGAYMAGDETVKVGVKILPARSTAACCYGGIPPVIQVMSGSGMALINAGGTLVKANGEILIIDSDSLVTFTDTIVLVTRLPK